MRRTEWWQTIKQDVVFGLRQLRKAPGFTAAAAGDAGARHRRQQRDLQRRLQRDAQAAAVRQQQTESSRSARRRTARTPTRRPFGNYASWRDDAHTLEAISAQWLGGSRTLTGRGDPAPVSTLSTTAGWWKVQFIPPVAGHYFADDERIGAPPVAVISYKLWQNRFNGDRAILGKQITLNATDYTVVGVAPAAYSIAVPDEMVWLPLRSSRRGGSTTATTS